MVSEILMERRTDDQIPNKHLSTLYYIHAVTPLASRGYFKVKERSRKALKGLNYERKHKLSQGLCEASLKWRTQSARGVIEILADKQKFFLHYTKGHML